MRSLLENTNEHRLSKDEMAYLAGDLFNAASDTVCLQVITPWTELT